MQLLQSLYPSWHHTEIMWAWSYGIWFIGSGVWLIVAALSLRFHMPGRTLGALAVAVVFFAAGMFFSRPGNQPRGRL